MNEVRMVSANVEIDEAEFRVAYMTRCTKKAYAAGSWETTTVNQEHEQVEVLVDGMRANGYIVHGLDSDEGEALSVRYCTDDYDADPHWYALVVVDFDQEAGTFTPRQEVSETSYDFVSGDSDTSAAKHILF